MKNEIYNIGLDIGTSSVGWCVTDEENNILKKGKRNMWGSRLFDVASKTNEGKDKNQKRRNHRALRRRKERRKERIFYLQEIFRNEMEKEYPNFFPLLKETSKISEEKELSESINGIKYNLFTELEFNDKTYYSKYKTIYHLRNELAKEERKADIRLIYLAMHHIIKYRGNFLYEGNLNNNNQIEEDLDTIVSYLKSKDYLAGTDDEEYGIRLKCSQEEILNILKDKETSKAEKKEGLIAKFEFDSSDKATVTNMINAILGYNFDITKIFNIQIEKSKLYLSKEIENEEEIENLLEDNVSVFYAMKAVYSWFVLQDILKGKESISEAFIDKYEKYKSDLKILKDVYKTYFKEDYADFFRKEIKNNYVHYNGKQIRKIKEKCDTEEFFKQMKTKISSLPEECEQKAYILNEIENENFLKKLNVTDNGAIPHQLHQTELEKIIENQKKYYLFLEKEGEKILKIFNTRIPYYIGPLAKNSEQSKFAWVVRKTDEHIRPWNMEEVIDVDQTAEEFINRMINRCTYLFDEKVMPKQSILYSKYCVLNELNNININERRLPKDTKKSIIEKLFMKRTKVTKKMVEELLKRDGMTKVEIEGLSNGTTFNSNMKSYIDMKNIFGNVEDNLEMCEEIIRWITIFEDKKILKRKIKKEYGKQIDEQQLSKLLKLKYTGWSRLSKQLLIGIKSKDNQTIMDKLESTPTNFMQIINDKEFGFMEEINKQEQKHANKITYNDIDEIQTSPANKRAIWQTICVVNEIKKIMKKEPKNVYIEFARNEEQKKQMKDNRAKKLLQKYEEIQSQLGDFKAHDLQVYKELKKSQNDKEITEKMYLYFLQQGKSLYSQAPLNIDELSNYQVDHIIPQSYIKDDSFDNKALVLAHENQNKKDNRLLSDEIIDKNIGWWKDLYNKGLMSQSKYFKLIRRKLPETENERNKFVARQLVETRQITKHVTNLLKNNTKETQVYAIRAELTHGFRVKYSLYKNRNVNDCHHAQDAYILSTIGNILDKEWNGLDEFQYGKYMKKYVQDEKSKNEKHGMIMGFINNRVDIGKVKKVMNYKDFFVTRMLEEQTGEFYNQTIQKAGKAEISLKNGENTSRYGGYTGENKAYCVIYTYIDEKNEKQFKLIGIPIKTACDIKSGKITIEDFIEKNDLKDKKYTDFKILRRKILKNQEYIDENGETMRLCSDSEIRTAKQLMVTNEMSKLIYIMNNQVKATDQELELLSESYEKIYDYLLEKMRNEYKAHNGTYEKVKDKKEEFKNMQPEKKRKVINGIISIMATGQGDLSEIGGHSQSGRKNNQKFGTKRLVQMTFIDKSVTGMYEKRYKLI